MKKIHIRQSVFILGFLGLILLISDCGLFRDSGVCTYFDTSLGDMVCVDDVTQKECEEFGGDFFPDASEPCY